jgi:hypothetical protein
MLPLEHAQKADGVRYLAHIPSRRGLGLRISTNPRVYGDFKKLEPDLATDDRAKKTWSAGLGGR